MFVIKKRKFLIFKSLSIKKKKKGITKKKERHKIQTNDQYIKCPPQLVKNKFT